MADNLVTAYQEAVRGLERAKGAALGLRDTIRQVADALADPERLLAGRFNLRRRPGARGPLPSHIKAPIESLPDGATLKTALAALAAAHNDAWAAWDAIPAGERAGLQDPSRAVPFG